MSLLYSILDLFPDVVKWAIIISMFIPYYFWFYRNLSKPYKYSLDLFSSTIWTIVVVIIWIGYFKIEVDVSISTWLTNVPDEAYNYVCSNPYMSGFTLLFVIFIIASYVVDFDESPSSISRYLDSLPSVSSYDDDRDWDAHKEGGSFSPSEARAFDAAEQIKKIRRNLRGLCMKFMH